jgi:hypothetical protein
MAGITSADPLSQEPLIALLGKVYPHEWYPAFEKCQIDIPEFFGPYRDGHPFPLSKASEQIMTILWQIQNRPEWQGFRDQIATTVSRMNNVKTMICLGLGTFCGTTGLLNPWIVQYAAFVYMWEIVNRKWQNECREKSIDPPTSVERIFQDPAIDKRTIYLLQKIPRDTDPGTNVVVEHPEALEKIDADRNTFVYAPHLPCRLSVTILSKQPQVYVGNCSTGPGGWSAAMIEEYMEECKFEGIATTGQTVNALWTRIQAARQAYDEVALNNEGPIYKEPLARISIFQRGV